MTDSSSLKPKRHSRKNDFQSPKLSGRNRIRLLLVWSIICASAFGLTLNLFQLQIVNAPELEKKARQQQMVDISPYIPRRPIIDRNGNILATDRLIYTLYAHPKLFKTPKEEIANKLAEILADQTSQELVKQFNQKESGIPIADALTEEVADQIAKLAVDGLELIQHYSRFYPQQELAADVVGYTDLAHQGQAGVEYSQEKFLERDIPTLELSRAGNGALMPTYLPKGILRSDQLSLQLTLDLRVQRVARFALKQQMEEFSAERGTVIVMDVEDGSILAMVCEPTYNPNRYSKFDIKLFSNWAVSDLYEPGSTFKPINVAIALEAGAIQPDSVFYDSGQIEVSGWPISNYDFEEEGSRGDLNTTQILQYSSNVGMVQIVQVLEPNKYYGWLKRLGIEQKVGIDLPSESAGQLKSKAQFTASPIEMATTSFGQGFSLTPIKLAQLHAALANGGKLVTPHVVDGLVNPQGQRHVSPYLSAPRHIFSSKTSRTVLEMMESVVKEGTGQSVQIPGYRIAGKTGTAQKASPTGGYQSDAKITSFVGILPVDSPRYVVLAVVDEPEGWNAFGSTVAAPIVKSVMEALTAIEPIPPSENLKDEG